MIGKTQFTSQPTLDNLPAPLIEATATLVLFLTQTARDAAKAEWNRLEAEKKLSASSAQIAPKTTRQVAEFLNVTTQTVHLWRREGKLPACKIGGKIFYKQAEVLAALQAQSTPDGRRKYARRQYQQKTR